ncbi:MAG: recombinase family protein [Coprococcus phoceensis]
MNGNEKYIAIYSRNQSLPEKAKVSNQIELCKEYIQTHYTEIPQDHILVYEDEGFSSSNLNRPDFKK